MSFVSRHQGANEVAPAKAGTLEPCSGFSRDAFPPGWRKLKSFRG
jgi:hypothetical protein